MNDAVSKERRLLDILKKVGSNKEHIIARKSV